MHLKLLAFAAATLLLAGCATSTIQSREAAQPALFAALPSAQQRLINSGEIASGMGTNAVFLAWGTPSKSVKNPAAPADELWVYLGGYNENVPYWSAVPDWRGLPRYEFRTAVVPRTYVRAEVYFHNGRVTRFDIHPPPLNPGVRQFP